MQRAVPTSEDEARALVAMFDAFSAVVIAIVSRDGILTAANKGFRDLTGIATPPEGGADARAYFVQPRFDRLAGTASDAAEVTFQGIVTLEDLSGRSQSVRGAVVALPEALVLVAEHDADGYRELAEHALALNEELHAMQRRLLRAKLELERRQEALRELSITDDLTGLKNRRHALERLEVERARVRRDGGQVSVLLLDVDEFKSVNDLFGHAVGDEVLRSLAAVIRRSVREYDLVARVGGDEHLVVLPDAGLDEAEAVARTLHHACRGVSVGDGSRRLTVSIGVATLHGDEPTSDLLSRADRGLYASKHGGRDRVTALPARGVRDRPGASPSDVGSGPPSHGGSEARGEA